MDLQLGWLIWMTIFLSGGILMSILNTAFCISTILKHPDWNLQKGLEYIGEELALLWEIMFHILSFMNAVFVVLWVAQ